MIHQMFSVYDSKTAAYLPPFFMQTKGQALRAIGDCANDREHTFHKHPEDYTLFYLGTYDDVSSKFEIEATPIALGVCLEFLKP